jgi:hypothetical protein
VRGNCVRPFFDQYLIEKKEFEFMLEKKQRSANHFTKTLRDLNSIGKIKFSIELVL